MNHPLSTVLIGELALQLSSLLGVNITIKQVEQLYGGDINLAFRFITSEGDFFLKLHIADHQPSRFIKEFNGLIALKNADGILVPTPLGWGQALQYHFLLTSFINKGIPAPNFWKNFAIGLARLHGCTQSHFGFYENNFIGSLPQSNSPHFYWTDFLISERLSPLLKEGYDKKIFEKSDLKNAERLYRLLPTIFPQEPPALLHGDLWSGNYLVTAEGTPCIFDPAVYYGHREMEIAMTLLFGGFDQQFYRYYNEITPLEKGWEQRIEICQLYPLLVHAILFGGSYVSSVKTLLKRF